MCPSTVDRLDTVRWMLGREHYVKPYLTAIDGSSVDRCDKTRLADHQSTSGEKKKPQVSANGCKV